ncbi:MAG: CRTAC1 family protein, partial [Chitinophagaceae bacterium]
MRLPGLFPITICSIVFLAGCKNDAELFKKINSSRSGIEFNNNITETDSINILDFSNVYNGGGVGIGDFNNDGLEDIYFTGNLVENKLYLNKGGFKFRDVTEQSGVTGEGKWCRGISIVDINNDGLQDMYISATIHQDAAKRENILYINTGIDKDGVPHFKNMATEYGLNDTTHTTQASFFDYDNDGDLDVYLCVNQILPDLYPNKFRPVIKDGSFPSTGRLYRNDWDTAAGHPVFKNVSKEAGITIEGYGHSVTISDINLDGWKDIYVTNDYLSSNILYINNGDGTFTDKISSYLKHSSANAMGADINDINNDGLMDIVELDMNPQDNFRKKMMLMPVSYQTYQNSDQFGYHYQYVRNTLQLNMGKRMMQNDTLSDPIFSEIGFYSGIAETDWSWAPVVADFDNDSYRDIIVTNGFPKDITDHDFAAFRQEAYLVATKQQLLEQIPEVKLHNYAYRNNGNLRFTDESFNWGLGDPTFSNGAAYADFDNDGDLDLVINNINDKALLYENTLNKSKDSTHNYLQVKLEGNTPNRGGFGAWIKLFYNGQQQVHEHYPVRGYLSSVTSIANFGLGNNKKIDSLLVIWPDNKSQMLYNIKADQVLTLKQTDAKNIFDWKPQKDNFQPLFKEITRSAGIDFVQQEIDYIDFNVQ